MALLDQALTGQVVGALLFFFLLFFIAPKYMIYKYISEIEEAAESLEGYARDAVEVIVKTARERGSPTRDPGEAVEGAMDFFLIPPVDLDPYGILRKVEHLLDGAEAMFETAAVEIAPQSDAVWRANIISLLKGGVGLSTLAKTVRHFVELVKKTNNLQIAMMLQMSLPLIKKVAEAQKKGVHAIAEGKPLGDGIGSLVVAQMIEGEGKTVAKDVICYEGEMEKRKVLLLKASGPGAKLGKIGDGVRKVCEGREIAKIITLDAGVKLEGERTGKVSRGIGAAIGDPGPEKAKIEDVAVSRDVPLDAYMVKMSVEEAIAPMTRGIGEAAQRARELLRKGVLSVPEGSTVVVVGVGNTCGIGNSREEVKDLKLPEKEVEKVKEGLVDRLMKRLVSGGREKR